MGFRLVPKSVTLNDLERRKGRYFALFSRIRQLWLRQKCSPKDIVFTNISLMALLSDVSAKSDNLINTARSVANGARYDVIGSRIRVFDRYQNQ